MAMQLAMDRFLLSGFGKKAAQDDIKEVEHIDLTDDADVKPAYSPAQVFQRIKEKDRRGVDADKKREVVPQQPVKKTQGTSISAILMPQKKKRLLVTLKVDPTRLKEALKPKQPEVIVLDSPTKETISVPEPEVIDLLDEPIELPKRKGHSFFAEVNERLNRIEKSPMRRKMKKHMEIPKLTIEMFLTEPEGEREEIDRMKVTNGMKIRTEAAAEEFECSAEEYMTFYKDYQKWRTREARSQSEYEYTHVPDETPDERIEEILHDTHNQALTRFKSLPPDSSSQWCDQFQPRCSRDILQDRETCRALQDWIEQAFGKLKRVNRAKRKESLANKAKKKQDDIWDFIVDDYEEEVPEDELAESFVPSLIITGPTGCGKTASVYAIVKEQMKGFVFEVNSSQPRGRKDIMFHLKQIGTTQLVNKGAEASRKRTVILFDDVDLVDDEEADKDFWSGATELLSCTYRPVIFTAESLEMIPKRIVEQSTVLEFKEPEGARLQDYLRVVGLTKGLDLDREAVHEVCRGDLRGSLMQLQLLGCGLRSAEGVTEVRVKKPTHPRESILERDLRYEMEYFMGELPPAKVEARSDRIQCVEFYSSQLFACGARKRQARYSDRDNYLEMNPGSSFEILSDAQIATALSPFMRSMARAELGRVEQKRFDSDPKELWPELQDHFFE